MTSNKSTLAFYSPIPISKKTSVKLSTFTNSNVTTYTLRQSNIRFIPKRAQLTYIPSLKPSRVVPRCVSSANWETISAAEFDEREASSSIAICFVGMSNCGKSFWSRQFQRGRGYHVVSVDEEIERAIEPELTALGYAGIDGMAEWMGFPSDERFAKNQQVYLRFEEDITSATSPSNGVNCVLDTTGSVVYLKQETLERIRREYLVVHLEASDDMLEFMTTNYFESPKPVVWGDAFQPQLGEESAAAIRRCYPKLLRERRKRYEAMAHITVPATVSLSRTVDIDTFLQKIKSKLK